MKNSGKFEEGVCTHTGRVGTFHFAAAPRGISRFRLMAVLTDGSVALIRLGETRREVLQRPLPIAEGIRGEVLGFRLDRWEGILGRGSWETVPEGAGRLRVARDDRA